MKLRSEITSAVLVLLPLVLASTVVERSGPSRVKDVLAREAKVLPPTASSDAILTKYSVAVGTKDAPVDGKDGKPHAGPFVDTERKAPKVGGDVEEASTSDSALKQKTASTALESSDGVMDDPSRQLPKHGTTGTGGGVSEKDKARKEKEGQTGEKTEKTPDPPKEAPSLPITEKEVARLESERKKSKSGDAEEVGDTSELSGLEKPKGLPEKTHDIPHPLPGSAQKDHLDIQNPLSTKITSAESGEEEDEGLIQPLHSYLLSLTMILFSEVGDKTFLIAALMAMKHDRILVFSAALSALMAMTVLSAVLGHAVPTLLPKRFTNFAAAILFLVFGSKMLREGLAMSPTEGVAAEMQEVEMELEEKEHQARQNGQKTSASPYALEMGLGGRSHSRKSRSMSRLPSPPRSPSSSPDRDMSPRRTSLKGTLAGLQNLFSLLLSPAWVQTFVMTFLGEWGDRSQIATIAMAAGQDYWWVTGGAISGHAVCTGVAVIGGRAIAGRVSLRVVTLGGAIAFLVFGVIYGAEAVYYA